MRENKHFLGVSEMKETKNLYIFAPTSNEIFPFFSFGLTTKTTRKHAPTTKHVYCVIRGNYMTLYHMELHMINIPTNA